MQQIITDRSLWHVLVSYLPSIGSIWGLLFYGVASYIVTFLIFACATQYVDRNIDVQAMVKERILSERQKTESRNQTARQIIKKAAQDAQFKKEMKQQLLRQQQQKKDEQIKIRDQ